MNMKLVKAKDEPAKVKSESEVVTLKCFYAFLRDCVSAYGHVHDRRVALDKDLQLNARVMENKGSPQDQRCKF